MNKILNEKEWAEEMIEGCSLGKRPVETLGVVARYLYGQGYGGKKLRLKLEDFLTRCGETPLKWDNSLSYCVKNASKHQLINIEGVEIFESELDTISQMDKIQTKRLAFTLLCCAKYHNAVNESNNNWTNTPNRELIRMSNINTPVKKQNFILYNMFKLGLINYGKRVDNLNIQVNFIDEGGKRVLLVDDFRNLGYQYMKYIGGEFIRCQQCGLTIKPKGSAHKFCDTCARERYIKKSVESVAKRRGAKDMNSSV